MVTTILGSLTVFILTFLLYEFGLARMMGVSLQDANIVSNACHEWRSRAVGLTDRVNFWSSLIPIWPISPGLPRRWNFRRPGWEWGVGSLHREENCPPGRKHGCHEWEAHHVEDWGGVHADAGKILMMQREGGSSSGSFLQEDSWSAESEKGMWTGEGGVWNTGGPSLRPSILLKILTIFGWSDGLSARGSTRSRLRGDCSGGGTGRSCCEEGIRLIL